MIDWIPFFELCYQRKINPNLLYKNNIISKDTFKKIRKNKVVNIAQVAKLCHALNCNVEDLIRWKND